MNFMIDFDANSNSRLPENYCVGKAIKVKAEPAIQMATKTLCPCDLISYQKFLGDELMMQFMVPVYANVACLASVVFRPTLPDGRVVNQLYYGSGHLHQINIDGEVVSDIERDQAHQEISRTQGALSSRYGYDPMGRLRAQAAQITQPVISQPSNRGKGQWEALGDLPTAQELNGRVVARRYDYDKSGNLTSILDKRFGVTSYHYDALGRILAAANRAQTGVITAETFAFDPAHNLLDASIEENATSNKSTNKRPITNNRLTVIEDKRYAYDSHGDLIDKKIGKHTRITLDWDVEHQLRASYVSRNAQQHYRPTEQTTHYGYDPFGRRLFKRDAFGVTRFVWDGNRLLTETRGSKSRSYLYEAESFVPLAQVDSDKPAPAQDGKPSQATAQILYFHKDHLGTPHELTDAQGNLLWAATYKAWGNVLRVETKSPQPALRLRVVPQADAGVEEIAQPLRFQGQYFDTETGLHYNRFRYYDPDIGRFISHDPVGLRGGNNLYQYAPNPISWIDPTGLTCNITTFWPPNRGALGEVENTTLHPGTKIDRYGYDGGTFVSPQGTPYPMRALASGTNLKPYSVFEVVKPIDNVVTSTIASWFGELGLGTQHELPKSVQDLLDSGHLKRIPCE